MLKTVSLMRFWLSVLCLASGLWAADGTQFETLLRKGLLALESNEVAAARKQLEEASRLDPSDARVWLGLAQAYWKSEERSRAHEAATKAHSLAPDAPVVLHGLAIFHSQAGNWAEAAEMESRFAESQLGDTDAFLRAALFYLRAKLPQKSIALARQGLAKENRADLQFVLARSYEAAGQAEEAEESFEEAIRLRPYEERYYFEFGHFLLRRQQFDRAVDVLLRGKKVFDKSPQLELLLGISYYGQRKFEQAVDSFLRTIDLAPGMEQPHAFLGRILSHAQDRIDEVTAKFAVFYKAQPDSYFAPYLYAKTLVAAMGPSGDPKVMNKAEALLRESLERKEDFWASHFVLGRLLEKKRDYAGAEKHLLRSIELNPDDSRPHYRLARVYTRLSKTDAAQREMELHAKLVEEEREAMRRLGISSDGGVVVE